MLDMSDELDIILLKEKLLEFLREDVGFGDLTTDSAIPPDLLAEATITSKSDGIVAGIRESQCLFQMAGVEVTENVSDGSPIQKGQSMMKVRGKARSILTVERTVLNILMRMSGIATLTRKLVEEARSVNPRVRIACTRKTTPGFRIFEKRAVELGGGDSHRLRLDDLILVKSNHIAAVGGIEEVIKKVKASASFTKKIEVEASTLEQAISAAKLGPDILMLDNLLPTEVEKVLAALVKSDLREKLLVEISGGVTSDTLKSYAKSGADIISMGSITHSAKALDINLRISRTWRV
jgi:nicotinate-nucleotide pyrophosphorylase (carboxylating)